MLRAFRPAPIILFSTLLFAGTACSDDAYEVRDARADRGMADLRSWNPARTIIKLDGEWEFHPGRFLKPGRTVKEAEYLPMPAYWNRASERSEHAHGTYRLRVQLPEEKTYKALALRLPLIMTSARLYAGPRLLAELGRPGTGAESTRAETFVRVVPIPADIGSEFVITLHVANYEFRNGGVAQSILLGPAENLRRDFERLLAFTLFLCGSIGLMGIYHLSLYAARRKDVSALFFGLLCLVISARTVLVGEQFINHLLFPLPFRLNLSLSYLTFYLGVPVFSSYIRSLYPDEYPRWTHRVMIASGLLFALSVVFPPDYFSRALIYFQAITLGFLIFLPYVMIKSIMRKRPHAGIFAAGLLVLLLTGGADIIMTFFSGYTTNYSSVGMLFFIFAHATLLARRFSRGFMRAEELSTTLEAKVRERTGQFQDARLVAEERRVEADMARLEVEKLNQFSRRLNETTDLELISADVAAYFTERFGLDRFGLLLVDETTNELYIAARFMGHDLNAEQRDFLDNFRVALRPETGSLYRAYEKQRSLYLHRIPNVPLGETDERFVRILDFQEFLHFPLIIQGKTTGIVFLARSRIGKRLSRLEVAAIARICEQIAGAVHGAKMMQQVREAGRRADAEREKSEQARSELETLSEVTRNINATSDLDEILELAFDHIQSFGVEGIWLFLVTADDREFISHKGKSFLSLSREAEDYVANLRLPIAPESGALWSTYSRQKTFYLRRIRRVKNDTDGDIVEALGLKSLAQFPILIQGKTIGILTLGNADKPLILSRTDRKALERFRDQIAGAIHTARLLNEKERARFESERSRKQAEAARSEIEKLSEFTRLVNETTDLRKVVTHIFDYMKEELGTDTAIMLTPEADGKHLRGYMSMDEMAPPNAKEYIARMRIPLNERGETLAHVYHRRRPTYMTDIERMVTRNPNSASMDRELVENLRAPFYYAVPLVVRDKSRAMMLFSSYTERKSLDREDRERIGRLCRQVAGAVYAADLVRQVQEERDRTSETAREIAQLNDITRRINENLSLDAVLERMMDYVRPTFDARMHMLFLVDENTNSLVYRSGIFPGDPSPEAQERHRARVLPLDEGGMHAGACARGKPVYFRRMRNRISASHVEAEMQATLRMEELLILPLVIGGRTIGCLDFSHGSESLNLTRDQISRLSTLADQIAGAIHNARLLQETEEARESADRLLLNILPEPVARELKQRGDVEPLQYESVTVLFTDFVKFTQVSAELSPDELVRQLDGCFSQFDAVIARNGLEKLKTIGDAYMCAGGIPRVNATHPVDACLAALEFQAFMRQMAEVKKYIGEPFWELRLGIHTGPVTAGVIGTNKFAYDIWGDTVNTASRMESAGRPGRINISSATHELVRDFFECKFRGEMKVKGKGRMPMYFVNRIRPELSQDEDGRVPNRAFLEMREAVGVGGALTP